ncbi:TorD/DmsD family molecular chaperone [Paraferrimonas haliotis]|uniref:TorD/DmsD family molecular chaperone n=1 Tax=Paraferrimonas haliotis TaxID=2013866 RepID=UPI000BA9A9CD|nr:molecular chaperone TorD family protein [Paraferrimonas haliotis]
MTDTFNPAEAAAICGILHNLYFRIPSQEYLNELQQAQVFNNWPIEAISDEQLAELQSALEQADYELVKRDYYDLHIGPGECKAFPYGSVYTDNENLVCGDTTIALMDFLKANDAQFDLPHKEPQDHVGLIFASGHYLLTERQDVEAFKALLEQHFLPWGHRVFELAETHANTDFCRELAKLTQATLNSWTQELGLSPEKLHLYR